MVIEFLHRVVATLTSYFDECSDSAIKENCVMVFEVSLSPPSLLFTVRDVSFCSFSMKCSTTDILLLLNWISSKILSNLPTSSGILLIRYFRHTDLTNEQFFLVKVTGRTNISEVLPSGQLSNIPWRRHGVKVIIHFKIEFNTFSETVYQQWGILWCYRGNRCYHR